MVRAIVSATICMWLSLALIAQAESTNVPPYDPLWKPTRNLTRFFAKLQAGEPVTIGAIGGSVTTRRSWADVTVEWLREEFPDNEITYHNFAEGGTPPTQTIWKVQRAVVPTQPDLMFVEYAVNSYGPPEQNFKALDGLVQQLLQGDDPPDIAFVYVGNDKWKAKDGWESEKVQPVGRHYGFPEVMARAHLQTKLDAGTVEWNVLFRDGIHPRLAGYNDPKQSAHAVYAEAVIALLQQQRAIPGKPTALPPLPPPFYSDAWTTAHVVPASETKQAGSWQAKPAQGTGGAYFKTFLESNQADSSLTLTTNTTTFVIFAYPGFDGGTIAWSVDGGPEKTYWMGKGSKDNFLTRVWSIDAALDLPPGEHTLKVWVGPQKEGALDNWVRIGGLGVAPTPEKQ